VPPEKRRAMEYGLKRTVVNPCSSSEMALFGHALQFWHLWNPRNKGRARDQVEFNCAELLSNELTATIPMDAFSPATRLGEKQDFASLIGRPKELRMTALFGVIAVTPTMPKRLERLRQQLSAKTGVENKYGEKLWSSWFAVPAAGVENGPDDPTKPGYNYYLASRGELDPGWMELLAFLRHLGETFAPSAIDVLPDATEGDSLVFTIKGKLKASQQKVAIRVFYGATTGLRGTRSPEHWRVLLDALKNDPVVVYNGHAALGYSLSMASMADALKITTDDLAQSLSSREYRLVALFDCYSYALFGDDIAKLRGGQTDLALSGTKDAGAKYAIMVLEMLDASYARSGVDFGKALSPALGKGDYVVFKRFPRRGGT
jgi:hypothetical protein